MFRLRFGNKYGATKANFQGIQYHSKREAREARDLEMQRRAGEFSYVKRQVRISLDVNGYHICNYIVDFEIGYPDGTIEYREVKGFETDVWRLKWKLFEALYSERPGIVLRVVR